MGKIWGHHGDKDGVPGITILLPLIQHHFEKSLWKCPFGLIYHEPRISFSAEHNVALSRLL